MRRAMAGLGLRRTAARVQRTNPIRTSRWPDSTIPCRCERKHHANTGKKVLTVRLPIRRSAFPASMWHSRPRLCSSLRLCGTAALGCVRVSVCVAQPPSAVLESQLVWHSRPRLCSSVLWSVFVRVRPCCSYGLVCTYHGKLYPLSGLILANTTFFTSFHQQATPSGPRKNV